MKYSYLITIIILVLSVLELGAALDSHYYDRTCPQAENIIFQAVRKAAANDPKVPPRILRMFFHDCFIRVLEASYQLSCTFLSVYLDD